ncbi:hypothetical protein CVT25_010489 [Psilocybe cyanescens]|uniref:Uncharacterized protein n=1 Tax=Psilocybe cyanescens TaxID=93625 RepID=A0A409XDF0_PSICY|nr:hypothetical protein CVT25_010489 [Psilocybe cyanescens]
MSSLVMASSILPKDSVKLDLVEPAASPEMSEHPSIWRWPTRWATASIEKVARDIESSKRESPSSSSRRFIRRRRRIHP